MKYRGMSHDVVLSLLLPCVCTIPSLPCVPLFVPHSREALLVIAIGFDSDLRTKLRTCWKRSSILPKVLGRAKKRDHKQKKLFRDLIMISRNWEVTFRRNSRTHEARMICLWWLWLKLARVVYLRPWFRCDSLHPSAPRFGGLTTALVSENSLVIHS